MEDKIRKSLKCSTLDGIFASIMLGLSENFITPYALAMKATVTQIGVLASIPNLVGSLSQLATPSVVDRLGSRMALIRPCVLLHGLMWIPIILTPYLIPNNAVVSLIIFVVLYNFLNTFDLPAWSSLMADHVPEGRRGSYFGWRNRLLGFINFGAALLAGIVLNFFKDAAFLGFTIIFSCAFLARLISWNFLRRMYEPPLAVKDEHRFTFAQFFRRIRASNFGRFVIFASAMSFSVNIVSPFLSVYMLKDLKFDYIAYTVIILAATLTSLSATKVWGVHADRVGNRRVLRLTSAFVPFVPLLWILSHNKLYLVAIQVFAGFFWSGFNLSLANFMFDAVTPEKRTRCIAYFNVINGSAVCLGALLGGNLVKYLPGLFGYKILTLAVISTIFRSFSSLLASGVKEVRAVKNVSSLDLFYSIIGIRPIINTAGKE